MGETSSFRPAIGILGGSGVYEIAGLNEVEQVEIHSEFGSPSDSYQVGTLSGTPVAFLARHGRGHKLPPTEINYRANIDGFKQLGVTQLLSLSAVGSLRQNLAPGLFVIVDQFVDRTFAREKSFFGAGCVAHVSMARPVCMRMGDVIEDAAKALDIAYARGGTYLVMEGPQFSSLAESEMYRAWNCDVIGMTNMPEAKLAREAEICYATVAMVTDYDCWHPHHDDVTVEQIVQVVAENAINARRLAQGTVEALAQQSLSDCMCRHALDHALMTAPDHRDPVLMKRLANVVSRVAEIP